MIPHFDIQGQRFGKWLVGAYAGKSHWHCTCDCGERRLVSSYTLRKGTSSGCVVCKNPARTTHGGARSRLHRIWLHMRRRCLKPKSAEYRQYGARGIKVCDAWHDFATFRDWALANGYRDDLTIDRKDNDGNYEPGNCRWATYAEQNLNTRKNPRVSFNGETITIFELAQRIGLKPSTLRQRILKYAWSVERAVSTPLNQAAYTFERIKP